MSLGENIRERREAIGWTQLRLAGEARVTTAAISYFESNQKIPNAFTFDAIAKALGVTMDELMNGRPKEGGRA